MATPLHSQNFVLAGEGVITNNRRLVTKNMWFNGTELTAKAQRALRHEQVTIVAHCSGHIHCVYPEATIDAPAYGRFQEALRAFMRTEITMEILANFLREHSNRQTCFQLRHDRHGRALYIEAEKAYSYEHSSSFKVSDPATRDKLLSEIDEDEFYAEPVEGRVLLNALDEFFRTHTVDPARPEQVDALMAKIGCHHFQTRRAIEELIGFARLEPRFPDRPGEARRFVPAPAIALRPDMTREEILAELERCRETHPVADLAFYAWRDWSRTDWTPFLKAAMERNPVSVKGAAGLTDDEAVARVRAMADESIYDGPRVAQPDEVWNYGRGDGLEKALAAANILKRRHPGRPARIEIRAGEVRLTCGGREERWTSAKPLDGAADL